MDGEAGTGMVASVVGVTAFLVMLLFAVQLTLNLYATSTVTAAAFDAARIVAGSGGGPEGEAEAEARLRTLLDGYTDLDLAWDYRDTDGVPGADEVALRVETEHPTRLLRSLPSPFQRLVRTVVVRVESFR